MRNFYFPRFFFLTLALFCIQNLSSTNRDTQAVDFESYSLEELNYDLCGLYNAKKLDAFDVTRNVENFRELSPSVYNQMTDPLDERIYLTSFDQTQTLVLRQRVGRLKKLNYIKIY